MFTLASTAHRTALHCIHLRKVHRCVQCAMCNSPVTWMCQLFVATAFYPSILIILWLGWQVPRNRFVLFNWSRESLVGGKRLPLSVKCLYILLKCHGTWAFYVNLLLYWIGVRARAIPNTMCGIVECILMIRTKWEHTPHIIIACVRRARASKIEFNSRILANSVSMPFSPELDPLLGTGTGTGTGTHSGWHEYCFGWIQCAHSPACLLSLYLCVCVCVCVAVCRAGAPPFQHKFSCVLKCFLRSQLVLTV